MLLYQWIKEQINDKSNVHNILFIPSVVAQQRHSWCCFFLASLSFFVCPPFFFASFSVFLFPICFLCLPLPFSCFTVFLCLSHLLASPHSFMCPAFSLSHSFFVVPASLFLCISFFLTSFSFSLSCSFPHLKLIPS